MQREYIEREEEITGIPGQKPTQNTKKREQRERTAVS